MTQRDERKREGPSARRLPLGPFFVLATAALVLLATVPATARETPTPRNTCATKEIVVGEARPLLTVVAPPTATSVRAYLPWGKKAELSYDEMRRHWSARVPRLKIENHWDLATWIRIRLTDGEVRWRRIESIGKHPAPLFLAQTPKTAQTGKTMPLEVDPLQPMRAVMVDLPWLNRGPVKLTPEGATGRFEGSLELPATVPHEMVAVRVTLIQPSGERRFGWFSLPVASRVGSCDAT